jgi:cellulose synthase/poly-beta-1,6-N-acetylglucosamine synthase-like glycosyltransferase
MKISIASLIYKSPKYADAVYKSLYEFTPLLQNSDTEFFFVANDASEKVINHLKNSGYKHYIHNNVKKTDKELFEMGIGWPNYLHGVYCAWNKAIELCQGEIVVLINSDMMFSKNWLENLLKHLNYTNMVCSHLVERIHPRLGVVFPGCIEKDFGCSPESFNKNGFNGFVDVLSNKNKNQIKDGGAYMPCAIYKDIILQAGMYPEGNIAANTFDVVAEYGDQCFVRKLNNIGVSHITALDSIVYHFKEGEMDDS